MKRISILLAVVAVVLVIGGACQYGQVEPAVADGELPGCDDLGDAVLSEDGSTRIAMLVGVGDYKNDDIPDLSGPPDDVAAIYRLLTDEDGYRFPPGNVCVLVDEQATVARFRDRFDEALVKRAEKADGEAIAFLFYAGHGSQVTDHNGDESYDGMDETFVFHDSRSGDVDDFRDDEFNELLAELYEHTKDVTVAFDSCNSGSATRAATDEPQDAVARLIPPRDDDAPFATRDSGVVTDEWTPESMPGLTILSAAKDGTSALEPRLGGHGFFTEAFLKVLTDVGGESLTWGQVSRRIPILVASRSYNLQHPVFQGERNKFVFDATDRKRPMGWEVVSVGDTVRMSGFALPGWGEGAHVRVFPGNVQAVDVKDPSKAKATLVLTSYDGTNAEGSLVGEASASIEAGDVATLVLPGQEAIILPVRLVKGADPEALTDEQADALETALAASEEATQIIRLTEAADAFSVGIDKDDRFRIRGPEGVIRNSEAFPDVGRVIESLGQHARQQALLMLEGEQGSEFVNDETLEVSLVPVSQGVNACSQKALKKWVQACPNEEQVVPLCATWQVQVKNNSKVDLLVGGAILWNDGGSQGLPHDATSLRVQPGGTAILDRALTFTSGPPLDALEHVVVFGTKESNPIDWSVLTEPAVRAMRGDMSPLESVLAHYAAGKRGGNSNLVSSKETWTSSKLPVRVLANAQFEEFNGTQVACDPSIQREFTVQDFNVDPYLPANDNYLKSVLEHGWFLADKANPRDGGDGIPYKQHGWDKGSGNATESDDAENLRVGIDCSRSIWYAFTRSGVEYTSRNFHGGYLSTAEMFDASMGSCVPSVTPEKSLMHEQFESCLGDIFQAGDVLVWQGVRPSDGKCVGHTVMVVDANKFVGWGSHGWDGSTDEDNQRLNDTGVEYQRILSGDWAKWDRKQYSLKACWRHREFIREAKVPGGKPGDAPLVRPCAVGSCES
jgi:hypothetical protein